MIQGTLTQWESVPLLVEVSGIMLKEQKLTEKELRGYRQWLSELDEESRESRELPDRRWIRTCGEFLTPKEYWPADL